MQLKHLLTILLFFSVRFSWSQEKTYLEQIRLQVNKEYAINPLANGLTSEQKKMLKKNYEAKRDEELKRLSTQNIIIEGPVFDFVLSIFNRIKASNPEIPSSTKLVLCKSNDFNAFTMGDDILFFHIGLIYDLTNEDEIALILGHEIAHNSLLHSEKSMLNYVLMVTDKNLKSEISDAKNSAYGRVSAINQILLPRLIETREISRAHEFESDSLGCVYAKKAGFNVDKAITAFQAMEYHDKGLNRPLSFNGFPTEARTILEMKTKTYKRSGSLGANEIDLELEPYLATHPYNRDRFTKLAEENQINIQFQNLTRFEDTATNNLSSEISELAFEVAIRDKNLTRAIYITIRQLDLNPEDIEWRERAAHVFYMLSFLKERRVSGKYLRLQNPKQCEDYDRICALAYSLSPQDCLLISNSFKIEASTLTSNQSIFYQIHLLNVLVKQDDKSSIEAHWLSIHQTIRGSNYSWMLNEIEEYLFIAKKYKFLKRN